MDPTGRIIDLGNGSKGKPKQNGDNVVISYSDGETATIKGKLLSPGDPNPAPPGAQQGVMNGPTSSLSPALALADTQVFLQQPELSDVFNSPIDLSYFQFDFGGTTPLPVFQGQLTYSTTDGLVSSIAIVTPEPTTALSMVFGLLVLLWPAMPNRLCPWKNSSDAKVG